MAEAQREFLDAISYFEEARGGDGSEAQGVSAARVQAFMDRAEREFRRWMAAHHDSAAPPWELLLTLGPPACTGNRAGHGRG